jgi:thiol-disulfide isomerase/thioredoxin
VPRLTRPAHQQRTSPSAAVATGAAVAILALAGCSAGAIGQNTPLSSGQNFVSGSGTTVYHPGSRPLAPDVSGRTLTGTRLRLDSFRGSVLVLNFWGSWCAPCRAEAPDLAALANRLGSRGVRFLGIDIQDDPTNAEAFMHTFQIPYPSLNDPGDEIALAFRDTVPAAAIPTTLVIDRTGHIAARVIGSVSYAGLKTLVGQVLAQKTGGGAAR